MNRSILFFLLLFCSHAAVAQTKSPLWEWKKYEKFSGTSIAIDKEDNVYICGKIRTNGTPPGVNDTNALHLTKYDKNGGWLWSKGYGTGYLDVLDMEIDPDGNLYLQGYNQSSGSIGSFLIDHDNISSDDAFVAKIDGAGDVVWAKSQSAPGDNGLFLKLGLDSYGNTYTSGVFFDTMHLDTQQLITGSFYGAIYIASYDKDGNLAWARSYDHYHIPSLVNLMATASPNGSNYITGRYKDSIRFENTVLYPTRPGGEDAFILKHDKNGNFLWAKNMSETFPFSITADDNNNVYIAGYFRDSVDLGAGYIKAEYSTDGFIAGVDKDGHTFISNGISDGPQSTFDMAGAISVDHTGNVFVSGQMSSKAFTCKFNPAGGLLWMNSDTISSTASYSSVTFGVRAGKDGNAYTLGSWDKDFPQAYGAAVGKLGLFPVTIQV